MTLSPRIMIGLAVALGAVVLAVVAPKLATAYAQSAALSRCATLKAARDQAALQGADPNEIARLDLAIRACSTEASRLGAPVDLGAETLTSCAAYVRQIASEMAHYRSTSYSDGIKRENTRQTMLRVGDQMASCFSQAIADAETPATLDAIRSALTQATRDFQPHLHGFGDRASGYDRSGDAFEPEGMTKANDWRARVLEPLRVLHAEATQKRDTIRRTAPQATP